MAGKPRRNTVLGGVVRGFTTVLLAGIVAMAIAVAVVPAVTHGKAMAVLSGSMEPTLHTGDMIVAAGVNNVLDVKIGDIITFMPDPGSPELVTHRVIGKGFEGEDVVFTTQGDNNDAADLDPVYGKQVRGKYLFKIPYLGYVSNWGTRHAAWAITGFAAILIAWGVWAFAVPTRRGREDQNADGKQDEMNEVSQAWAKSPDAPEVVHAANDQVAPTLARVGAPQDGANIHTGGPPDRPSAGPSGAEPIPAAAVPAPAPLTRAALRQARTGAPAAPTPAANPAALPSQPGGPVGHEVRRAARTETAPSGAVAAAIPPAAIPANPPQPRAWQRPEGGEHAWGVRREAPSERLAQDNRQPVDSAPESAIDLTTVLSRRRGDA
ncbi:MAG: signal peptidase I [Bifidobacteriaceae bacterium]|jgi:signal peptidase I|nr:signal peptidase I [Bifidobacteriaceae bacterium]